MVKQHAVALHSATKLEHMPSFHMPFENWVVERGIL
jgi:hypothetical protein